MQNTIPNITIHYREGLMFGGFDLNTALIVASEIKASGREVFKLTQGPNVLLEGSALQELI